MKGEFTRGEVIHDEVDAIMSALVGTFFWCGRFEAMGVEDEDYLIVPDLKTTRNGWHERYVVGISGAIAAGKTTAANTLRERGFVYARYSEVLADMLRERGREANRRSLQEIGEEVHRIPGQRWLSTQLLARIPWTPNWSLSTGSGFRKTTRSSQSDMAQTLSIAISRHRLGKCAGTATCP